MFYEQFLNITDVLNLEFVEKFDYWLTTLPERDSKNITASFVSAKFEVMYTQAERILEYACGCSILKKRYVGKCPDCDFVVGVFDENNLADALIEKQFCDSCDKEVTLSADDIFTVFELVKRPDLTEEEIAKVIDSKLKLNSDNTINFLKADSLASNLDDIYKAFYNPSDEAYERFKDLRNKLDLDYGKNTTAKGSALEKLILEIFSTIKGVSPTDQIKTLTNQFDCTAICGAKIPLSIFEYLAPYFIIESKNEPNKKPNNTYCNKLQSIMDTNEAHIGIIFGRLDATSTCFSIAREHYLTTQNGSKKVILTFSDNDLNYLIDKRINLLKYLEFKVFQVTANAPNARFEMFVAQDRMGKSIGN